MKGFFLFISLFLAAPVGADCISKDDFKEYALKDGFISRIKDIHYPQEGSIWVHLKDQHTMNKIEMKNVAEILGMEFIDRTCYKNMVIITVWDYATENWVVKATVRP